MTGLDENIEVLKKRASEYYDEISISKNLPTEKDNPSGKYYIGGSLISHLSYPRTIDTYQAPFFDLLSFVGSTVAGIFN